MKKYLVIIALTAGLSGFAQSFITAVKSDSLSLEKLPDLSYYSKNYNTVFGEYNYTFDTVNFGTRNVYVSGDNFYYSGSQNLPYMLPSNNLCAGLDDFTDATATIGISIIGITALFKGDIFAKDYSPKNVDSSLFHPNE